MEPTQLDRTHQLVLETFVELGHAPHYTEIARKFGVPLEEGKKLLRDLMNTGMPRSGVDPPGMRRRPSSGAVAGPQGKGG